MHRHFFAFSIISLACVTGTFAATPIDLKQHPLPLLQASLTDTTTSFKEISSNVDFNQTKHTRVQEYFSNYPVWGADAIVHEKQGLFTAHKTTMNGTAYQNLQSDLAGTPAYVFTAAQADKALQSGAELYQKKTGIKQVSFDNAKKQLMVYVDKNNKAHWTFLVSFLAKSTADSVAVPTYILDATSMHAYEEWNDAQTLDDTSAGGFGGNQKMGELTYDGAQGDYPVLSVQHDAAKKLCYLKNANVTVLDGNHKRGPFSDADVAQFKCDKQDAQHNQLYWDGDQDAVNGAYSPANDALYIGQVIHDMYDQWYGLPALSKGGVPMMLKMNVHAKDFFSGQPMENAMFLSLNSQMYFGDGVKMFYPLTSLGVGAHEISHGFTAQHSNLTYQEQSGGLNESFSDMAAQAAEFFSTGTNSWEIGPEILKEAGALRYMANPTKDGHSIDNVNNYNNSLNVHYTSGVFNKAFYLLATADGWNTRKAFDVMVKANMNYWTSNSTFAQAACGVVSATKDYNYDVTAAINAMKGVGIDVSGC